MLSPLRAIAAAYRTLRNTTSKPSNRTVVILVVVLLIILASVMVWVISESWAVALVVACSSLFVLLLFAGVNFAVRAFSRRRDEILDARMTRREGVLSLTENWLAQSEALRKRGIDRYRLPFYMLVGEPQSGKTTTIKRSTLHLENPDPTRGVGGTANCDWWFAEEAVILDTAGRLPFRRQATDKAEWTAFLELLKSYRPRCPVNGVIVVIPCDALLQDTPEVHREKARVLHDALAEIEDSLEVRFPVFVLLTKGDKIAGYREFFFSLRDAERVQLVGWSRPNERNDMPLSETEFRAAVSDITARLRRWRIGLMNDNRVRQKDNLLDRLYSFPEEFDQIREPLMIYLTTIFRESKWRDALFLRGIYITSGEQKGDPLVRACQSWLTGGAGSILQTEANGPQSSPEERVDPDSRATFIDDFYMKKVFPEMGFVLPTKSRVATVFWTRFAAVALLIAVIGSLVAYNVLHFLEVRRSCKKPAETLKVIAGHANADPARLEPEQLVEQMKALRDQRTRSRIGNPDGVVEPTGQIRDFEDSSNVQSRLAKMYGNRKIRAQFVLSAAHRFVVFEVWREIAKKSSDRLRTISEALGADSDATALRQSADLLSDHLRFAFHSQNHWESARIDRVLESAGVKEAEKSPVAIGLIELSRDDSVLERGSGNDSTLAWLREPEEAGEDEIVDEGGFLSDASQTRFWSSSAVQTIFALRTDHANAGNPGSTGKRKSPTFKPRTDEFKGYITKIFAAHRAAVEKRLESDGSGTELPAIRAANVYRSWREARTNYDKKKMLLDGHLKDVSFKTHGDWIAWVKRFDTIRKDLGECFRAEENCVVRWKEFGTIKSTSALERDLSKALSDELQDLEAKIRSAEVSGRSDAKVILDHLNHELDSSRTAIRGAIESWSRRLELGSVGEFAVLVDPDYQATENAMRETRDADGGIVELSLRDDAGSKEGFDKAFGVKKDSEDGLISSLGSYMAMCRRETVQAGSGAGQNSPSMVARIGNLKEPAKSVVFAQVTTKLRERLQTALGDDSDRNSSVFFGEPKTHPLDGTFFVKASASADSPAPETLKVPSPVTKDGLERFRRQWLTPLSEWMESASSHGATAMWLNEQLDAITAEIDAQIKSHSTKFADFWSGKFSGEFDRTCDDLLTVRTWQERNDKLTTYLGTQPFSGADVQRCVDEIDAASLALREHEDFLREKMSKRMRVSRGSQAGDYRWIDDKQPDEKNPRVAIESASVCEKTANELARDSAREAFSLSATAAKLAELKNKLEEQLKTLRTEKRQKDDYEVLFYSRLYRLILHSESLLEEYGGGEVAKAWDDVVRAVNEDSKFPLVPNSGIRRNSDASSKSLENVYRKFVVYREIKNRGPKGSKVPERIGEYEKYLEGLFQLLYDKPFTNDAKPKKIDVALSVAVDKNGNSRFDYLKIDCCSKISSDFLHRDILTREPMKVTDELHWDKVTAKGDIVLIGCENPGVTGNVNFSDDFSGMFSYLRLVRECLGKGVDSLTLGGFVVLKPANLENFGFLKNPPTAIPSWKR